MSYIGDIAAVLIFIFVIIIYRRYNKWVKRVNKELESIHYKQAYDSKIEQLIKEKIISNV